jgi:NADH-quinone oxidoreductase subunit E
MCQCSENTPQITDKDKQLFDAIEKYKVRKGALIPLLQAAQEIYGYLPPTCIAIIAKELKIGAAKVYGVATIYAQFRLKPRGKNIVRICLGTACHVRGGVKILEAIEKNLGIKDGGTTSDLNFTLESVACLGACGLAPVIMVNDETFGRLTADMIGEILNKYRERGEE